MEISDWMNNPAVQGGIMPFVVAALITLLLARIGNVSGLAILAGFLSAVALTTGISFDPLTSTRKIVLIALITPFLAAAVVFLKPSSKRLNALYAIASAGAILWVVWPVIARKELLDAVVPAIGLAVFGAVIVLAYTSLRQHSRFASGAGIAAGGFGVGGAAIFGASASLGQWGIALGASACGYLLVHLVARNKGGANDFLLLPAAFILALVASASVIYAKVPWYVLLCFVPIPLVVRFAFPRLENEWLRTIVWFLIAMIPAGIGIVVTLQSQGPVPF